MRTPSIERAKAFTGQKTPGALPFALCATPLAWLWFVLINNLRVEWTLNPQYAYGWAVPFLCVFLLWQKLSNPENRRQKSEISDDGCGRTAGQKGLRISVFCFVFLAFGYFPTRLVEEANPGWRLVSWALAIETVGLTLCVLRMMTAAGGQSPVMSSPSSALRAPPSRLRLLLSAFQEARFLAFVFPVCYFLVAVPWPSLIEQPLIQELTRIDTHITTELLGWIGIPALPRGNVIEVATGVVGIDEACSGIRSFQATLMISLFLGEFYRLKFAWRIILCLSGFALALLFNFMRMSLLVWVAARQGIGAVASWHDPAGVTILVACFFCLWGMGVWLKTKAETLTAESGKRKTEGGDRRAESGGQQSVVSGPRSGFWSPASVVRRLAIALMVWLVLTEVSVEGWYRWHEARVPRATEWTIAWPTNNPTFKIQPLDERTRQILRYDGGRSAGWSAGDLTWHAVFLRWNPGHTAVHLAENHTPNVCLTAAGYKLEALTPQEWFNVKGLRLPFSVNKVENAGRPFYVFYCLWDDRTSVQGFQTMGLTYGRRLAPVLVGLRNPGQRSLEISVAGPARAAAAEADLRRELQKLIVAKP